MNVLTRWDPFKELEELQTRINALYGRPAMRREGEKEEAITVAQWSPLVDIVENQGEYVITAELPGLKKDDVKVVVEEDVLMISGERKLAREEGKKYHRVERSYGTFARSFSLPEDADGARVAAEFKDGLLHIRLPKSERAKPKTIEIKVG